MKKICQLIENSSHEPLYEQSEDAEDISQTHIMRLYLTIFLLVIGATCSFADNLSKAEYYQKKAEGYRREAAYYEKKAKGYEAIPQYYKDDLELLDTILHMADDLYRGEVTKNIKQ